MADEPTAYPDSSDFSEQLSYINYVHLTYGLFSMIFQSLKDFLEFWNIPKFEFKQCITFYTHGQLAY